MAEIANVQLAQELLVLPDRFISANMNDTMPVALREMISHYVNHFTEYSQQGIGPGFFGTAGAGKTYSAAVLSRMLAAAGVPVYWAPTVSELTRILDYKDFRSAKYFMAKDRLLNTRVVVFDDFGQLKDFPRIRDLFFELIDGRYSWKLPTIFTANIKIEKESDWENQVAQLFNSSLARRIKDMTKGLVYKT